MDEFFREIVGPYGAIFLMLWVGVTGFMGKWVFSKTLDNAMKLKDDLIADKEKTISEKQDEINEWKGIALRALNVSEKVVKGRER